MESRNVQLFKALILSKEFLFIILVDALLNVGVLHGQKDDVRLAFLRLLHSFILQNKVGFLHLERKKSRLVLRVAVVR